MIRSTRFAGLALAAGVTLFGQSGPDPLKDIKYRLIGPFRGGRSVAVTGVTSQPNIYYFGAIGGGVWKTTDGGADGIPFPTARSRPAQSGLLPCPSRNPASSTSAWASLTSAATPRTATACINPMTPAAPGNTSAWKKPSKSARSRFIPGIPISSTSPPSATVRPNEERGIYKTTDGGKTWKQVFTRGPKAGAVELVLDPGNPNTLFAAFWEVYRTPWILESGGPGSGLFKSTDGGETWTDLSRAPGMPKGILGRIGVAVSPVNPDRVWALVEAEDGGVFRSDDAGKTWTKINEQRILRQRAWYYSRIFADPLKLDTIYVTNVGFYRSDDGGQDFHSASDRPMATITTYGSPPNDSNRMIEANDGGATISTNGGSTWSTIMNQPTAQFYRVALDNDFPYHAYGAQQDNTTVKIADASRWPRHHRESTGIRSAVAKADGFSPIPRTLT